MQGDEQRTTAADGDASRLLPHTEGAAGDGWQTILGTHTESGLGTVASKGDILAPSNRLADQMSEPPSPPQSPELFASRLTISTLDAKVQEIDESDPLERSTEFLEDSPTSPALMPTVEMNNTAPPRLDSKGRPFIPEDQHEHFAAR